MGCRGNGLASADKDCNNRTYDEEPELIHDAQNERKPASKTIDVVGSKPNEVRKVLEFIST